MPEINYKNLNSYFEKTQDKESEFASLYLNKHRQLVSRIANLICEGNIFKAVSICKEATEKYQDNPFYPKIMGDLFIMQNDYSHAAKAYFIYLKRIKPTQKLFSYFAKRYYRLKRHGDINIRIFALRLADEIKNKSLSPQIVKWTESLIKKDIEKIDLSYHGHELIKLIQNNEHFDTVVKQIKKVEEVSGIQLELILDRYILNRERNDAAFRTDSYCVSIYERFEKFDNALKIAVELLVLRKEPVLIRSIFRVCRKIGDYSTANKIIERYPQILKGIGGFNIQYELVYYYEHYDRLDELELTLKRIEREGLHSIPIQKTVRNFYISFGMLEHAQRVEKNIEQLSSQGKESSKRFTEAVKESEAEITSKIKELYSKVEHHERIAAISDLTTGISHELGQPITNIRYTVQFHRKMLEKFISKEQLLEAFDSILDETKRMGDLVKRLAPLTSTRNVIEKFDLITRIQKRLNALNNRLIESKIAVELLPKHPVHVFGDPIHFDQIINNLLINAIDSINQNGKTRNNKISIRLSEDKDNVTIIFIDTGVGINAKYRGKIFDPFYTTKAPGKGEGLGLFIIWNLLKINGGKIQLDFKYNKGAKFIINLPKQSEYKKEM